MEDIIKDELEFYSKFTKTLIFNLPDAKDRVLAASWVKKIRDESVGTEKLRTDYLKLLLFALQRRHLVGIFADDPAKYEKLDSFPPEFDLNDIAKSLVQKEQGERQDRILRQLRGEIGDNPPYITDCSSDFKEYVAAQDIPGFGVHCYYAISKEPVNTWQRADRGIFPKMAKSAVDTTTPVPPCEDAVATAASQPSCVCAPKEGEADTECVPGDHPAAPPPKKKRGQKLGTKPPVAPMGVVGPPEDRPPPTWGSNLLEVRDVDNDQSEPEDNPLEEFELGEAATEVEQFMKEFREGKIDKKSRKSRKPAGRSAIGGGGRSATSEQGPSEPQQQDGDRDALDLDGSDEDVDADASRRVEDIREDADIIHHVREQLQESVAKQRIAQAGAATKSVTPATAGLPVTTPRPSASPRRPSSPERLFQEAGGEELGATAAADVDYGDFSGGIEDAVVADEAEEEEEEAPPVDHAFEDWDRRLKELEAAAEADLGVEGADAPCGVCDAPAERAPPKGKVKPKASKVKIAQTKASQARLAKVKEAQEAAKKPKPAPKPARRPVKKAPPKQTASAASIAEPPGSKMQPPGSKMKPPGRKPPKATRMPSPPTRGSPESGAVIGEFNRLQQAAGRVEGVIEATEPEQEQEQEQPPYIDPRFGDPFDGAGFAAGQFGQDDEFQWQDAQDFLGNEGDMLPPFIPDGISDEAFFNIEGADFDNVDEEQFDYSDELPASVGNLTDFGMDISDVGGLCDPCSTNVSLVTNSTHSSAAETPTMRMPDWVHGLPKVAHVSPQPLNLTPKHSPLLTPGRPQFYTPPPRQQRPSSPQRAQSPQRPPSHGQPSPRTPQGSPGMSGSFYTPPLPSPSPCLTPLSGNAMYTDDMFPPGDGSPDIFGMLYDDVPEDVFAAQAANASPRQGILDEHFDVSIDFDELDNMEVEGGGAPCGGPCLPTIEQINAQVGYAAQVEPWANLSPRYDNYQTPPREMAGQPKRTTIPRQEEQFVDFLFHSDPDTRDALKRAIALVGDIQQEEPDPYPDYLRTPPVPCTDDLGQDDIFGETFPEMTEPQSPEGHEIRPSPRSPPQVYADASGASSAEALQADGSPPCGTGIPCGSASPPQRLISPPQQSGIPGTGRIQSPGGRGQPPPSRMAPPRSGIQPPGARSIRPPQQGGIPGASRIQPPGGRSQPPPSRMAPPRSGIQPPGARSIRPPQQGGIPGAGQSPCGRGQPPPSGMAPPGSGIQPPGARSLRPPQQSGIPGTGRIQSPCGRGQPPPSGMAPPVSGIQPPGARSLRPPQQSGIPGASRIQSPCGRGQPPPSGMAPPVSGIQPPGARSLRPPQQGGIPGASRIQPPGGRGQPPASRMAPPVSGIQPPGARSLRPPQQSGIPGASRIQPPGGRGQPPASRMAPPGSGIPQGPCGTGIQRPASSRLQQPGSGIRPPVGTAPPPPDGSWQPKKPIWPPSDSYMRMWEFLNYAPGGQPLGPQYFPPDSGGEAPEFPPLEPDFMDNLEQYEIDDAFYDPDRPSMGSRNLLVGKTCGKRKIIPRVSGPKVKQTRNIQFTSEFDRHHGTIEEEEESARSPVPQRPCAVPAPSVQPMDRQQDAQSPAAGPSCTGTQTSKKGFKPPGARKVQYPAQVPAGSPPPPDIPWWDPTPDKSPFQPPPRSPSPSPQLYSGFLVGPKAGPSTQYDAAQFYSPPPCGGTPGVGVMAESPPMYGAPGDEDWREIRIGGSPTPPPSPRETRPETGGAKPWETPQSQQGKRPCKKSGRMVSKVNAETKRVKLFNADDDNENLEDSENRHDDMPYVSPEPRPQIPTRCIPPFQVPEEIEKMVPPRRPRTSPRAPEFDACTQSFQQVSQEVGTSIGNISPHLAQSPCSTPSVQGTPGSPPPPVSPSPSVYDSSGSPGSGLNDSSLICEPCTPSPQKVPPGTRVDDIFSAYDIHSPPASFAPTRSPEFSPPKRPIFNRDMVCNQEQVIFDSPRTPTYSPTRDDGDLDEMGLPHVVHLPSPARPCGAGQEDESGLPRVYQAPMGVSPNEQQRLQRILSPVAEESAARPPVMKRPCGGPALEDIASPIGHVNVATRLSIEPLPPFQPRRATPPFQYRSPEFPTGAANLDDEQLNDMSFEEGGVCSPRPSPKFPSPRDGPMLDDMSFQEMSTPSRVHQVTPQSSPYFSPNSSPMFSPPQRPVFDRDMVCKQEPVIFDSPRTPTYSPTRYDGSPTRYDGSPTRYDGSPTRYGGDVDQMGLPHVVHLPSPARPCGAGQEDERGLPRVYQAPMGISPNEEERLQRILSPAGAERAARPPVMKRPCGGPALEDIASPVGHVNVVTRLPIEPLPPFQPRRATPPFQYRSPEFPTGAANLDDEQLNDISFEEGGVCSPRPSPKFPSPRDGPMLDDMSFQEMSTPSRVHQVTPQSSPYFSPNSSPMFSPPQRPVFDRDMVCKQEPVIFDSPRTPTYSPTRYDGSPTRYDGSPTRYDGDVDQMGLPHVVHLPSPSRPCGAGQEDERGLPRVYQAPMGISPNEEERLQRILSPAGAERAARPPAMKRPCGGPALGDIASPVGHVNVVTRLPIEPLPPFQPRRATPPFQYRSPEFPTGEANLDDEQLSPTAGYEDYYYGQSPCGSPRTPPRTPPRIAQGWNRAMEESMHVGAIHGSPEFMQSPCSSSGSPGATWASNMQWSPPEAPPESPPRPAAASPQRSPPRPAAASPQRSPPRPAAASPQRSPPRPAAASPQRSPPRPPPSAASPQSRSPCMAQRTPSPGMAGSPPRRTPPPSVGGTPRRPSPRTPPISMSPIEMPVLSPFKWPGSMAPAPVVKQVSHIQQFVTRHPPPQEVLDELERELGDLSVCGGSTGDRGCYDMGEDDMDFKWMD